MAPSIFISGPRLSYFRGTGHHPWNRSNNFLKEECGIFRLREGLSSPITEPLMASRGLGLGWACVTLLGCIFFNLKRDQYTLSPLEITSISRIIISSRCKSLAVTMQLGSLVNDQRMPRGSSRLKPPTERILSVNTQVLGLLILF